MIYDTLAIFSDVELVEVEFTLNQFTLMNQKTKNQLISAVENYRFLVSKLPFAKGLDQQVILFLLDPKSCTQEGIDEFLGKLETWLVILENETEQRIYAEILHCWSGIYLDTEEILMLRSELVEVVVELQKIKKSQDSLVKTKVPMQLNSEFDEYANWMMVYGSEFESSDSSFNIVPNLKGKFNSDQIPFYNAFSVYVENWEPPMIGSETIIG